MPGGMLAAGAALSGIGAATGITGSAALVGGATLGSALIGSNAAYRGSKSQSKAAALARADQMPYAMPGRGAVASLAQLYGIDPNTGALTGQPFPEGSLEAFRRSPDYQFASDEGRRQVEFSNAGRGLLRSGNNMRDLVRFGQGLATQQFGQYRGALMQLAQLGQGAASAAGQASMAQGAAQASGPVGAANSWMANLGSLGNYAMLSNLIGQQRAGLPQPQGSLTAYAGAAAPYGPVNPTGFSSVLPGGVGNGAAPY